MFPLYISFAVINWEPVLLLRWIEAALVEIVSTFNFNILVELSTAPWTAYWGLLGLYTVSLQPFGFDGPENGIP